MAIFEAIIPAIAGSIVSGAFASNSQSETNALTAAEAQKNRDFNAFEATKARDFNSAEAVEQRNFAALQAQTGRDFAASMSSSGYQRAVNDLKRAGLNPMLAYSQGPAPTPATAIAGGSAAVGPAASHSAIPSFGNPAAAGLAGAGQAASIANAIKTGANIEADTDLKRAVIAREESTVQWQSYDRAQMAARIDEIQQKILNMKQEAAESQMRTQTEFYRGRLTDVLEGIAQFDKMIRNEEVSQSELRTIGITLDNLLKSLALPAARNAANAQDSWWMKNVSPYLPDFLKSTIGVGAIVK